MFATSAASASTRDATKPFDGEEQIEKTLTTNPLKLYLEVEKEFDAIFTDVGMPGMSGWELAREIRQINKEIPIAVITGWGEAVSSNEVKAAGVDWVVAKPFTADRIAELVCEVNQLNATRQKVAIVAA